MSDPRVHEIASFLGIASSKVMEDLMRMDEFVKSASSVVALPVAIKLIEAYGSSAEVFSHGSEGSILPELRRNANKAPISAPDSDINASILAVDPMAPSQRQVGWHAGAVPRPRHPALERKLSGIERRFDVLNDHRNALARLGSQIVYGTFLGGVYSDCAVVSVRFSGAIESAFGFTRELMLLYTPFRDLQQRTFEMAFTEVKRRGDKVTPDIVFIRSEDPRANVKLDDWSSPGRLAIPFDFDEDDPVGIVRLLKEHLHARDLFNETTPVTGVKFFGRKTLLQSLRDDVLHQRVSGIFGLRKAGKTSVLMQLSEDLQHDRVISVLVDLETFPSPPDDPVDDIITEIRRRVLEEVKVRGLSASKMAQLAEGSSIVKFKNALQTLVEKLSDEGYTLLLMLDEIEYLTPADRIDVAEGPMPRISQFLASLRSVVQETSNFTFLLSGLTSAILESGRLYGRPNPLFSWAKSNYLGPFERQDADNLAKSVGARMGIAIDPGALEALYEASGGHAYLYRNLASAVVASLDMEVDIRRITRAAVLRELEDWEISVRGHVHEMINHVGRYYPTESVVLELLMEDPAAIDELIADEPEAIRHLIDLGLLSRSEDGPYQLNILLDLL